MFLKILFLLFLNISLFAQTGTLKIVTNVGGTFKIDGEDKGNIEANSVKKFDLKADVYILQFFPTGDKNNPLSKEVSIKKGKSETVNFKGAVKSQNNNNSKSKKDALDIEMVFVQGGTFTMGCTEEQGADCIDNEIPVHQVTLSDFKIGKYEVTVAQWKAVMGKNPSCFSGCDQCPVGSVNWYDLQAFINRLNAKTGKTYRLPTEAEWEYAARGGNKSQGYSYSGADILDNAAWHDGNCDPKTYKVGTKAANELGIHDMSGNVWEWCSDWYGDYSAAAQNNPQGASNGRYRVLRGGSSYDSWLNCRVTSRVSSFPDFMACGFGFRLALVP